MSRASKIWANYSCLSPNIIISLVWLLGFFCHHFLNFSLKLFIESFNGCILIPFLHAALSSWEGLTLEGVILNLLQLSVHAQDLKWKKYASIPILFYPNQSTLLNSQLHSAVHVSKCSSVVMVSLLFFFRRRRLTFFRIRRWKWVYLGQG